MWTGTFGWAAAILAFTSSAGMWPSLRPKWQMTGHLGVRSAAADLTPKCPAICHFGRKDGHIPADEVKAKIAAAQPNVPVHIYEHSGHGFNNDGRPDSDADD